MPEATAARNQNSIGDRMEKKPWEKPGSVGGPVPLEWNGSRCRPDKRRRRTNGAAIGCPSSAGTWRVPHEGRREGSGSASGH